MNLVVSSILNNNNNNNNNNNKYTGKKLLGRLRRRCEAILERTLNK
jgi:hypothetical protein